MKLSLYIYSDYPLYFDSLYHIAVVHNDELYSFC